MTENISEKIDLNKIEKKAYGSFFQKWLYDVGFGVLLLSFAVAPTIRALFGYVYILFLVVPASLVMFLGFVYGVLPRVGIAKFSRKRQQKRNRIAMVNAVGVIALMALVILTYYGVFPGLEITGLLGGLGLMAAIGIAVIVGIGFFAYVMDFPRMALYGTIIGVGIPLVEFIKGTFGSELSNAMVWVIPALILVILGLIEYSKFKKEYPLDGGKK